MNQQQLDLLKQEYQDLNKTIKSNNPIRLAGFWLISIIAVIVMGIMLPGSVTPLSSISYIISMMGYSIFSRYKLDKAKSRKKEIDFILAGESIDS